MARRLEAGRGRPGSSAGLSFAIVTGLTNRLRNYLTALIQEVWRLEQTVTDGHLGDPEQFLEELFRVRHGLLAILWVPRTLALALTWHEPDALCTWATAGIGMIGRRGLPSDLVGAENSVVRP